MSSKINLCLVILAIISSCLLFVNVYEAAAQKEKKNKLRITADYTKTMNRHISFNIKVTSRIERKTVGIPNIELSVLNELDDESIKLGSVTTDLNGVAKLIISDFNLIKPDASGVFTVKIIFQGNHEYLKVSKSLAFRDASIVAKVIIEDSINYLTALLKDAAKDSILVEQYLNVRVKRLFKSLKIGPDFVTTDNNGTIIVPIKEGIPGVNGILTFEVILSDHEDYGTVIALVDAPVGIPIVEDTKFHKRTMWASRSKTPLTLLIFPNVFILCVWGLIIYLVLNLFKISKSNYENT